jgi:hypothetical protein
MEFVSMKKRKRIVTEGTYWVSLPNGDRKKVTLTRDQIYRIAATGNAMVSSGLRIPAPWKHDLNATPMSVGTSGSGGIDTPYDNAGFWDNFTPIFTKDGKVALEGDIDSPGDEKDANSPAFKVGNLVKDTSIFLVPEYMDGQGNKWQDALMHIAVCHHPIEAGQEGFRPAHPNELAIAMSQMDAPPGDKKPDGDDKNKLPLDQASLVGKLLQLLPKKGITLPADTSLDNVIDRLVTALEALTAPKDGTSNNPLAKSPNGAEYTQMPVIMAALNDAQVDSLIKSGSINPMTNKPWAKEDFGTQQAVTKEDYDKVNSQMTVLMGEVRNKTVGEYKNRVQALIDKKVITAEYAQNKLAPLFDGIAMSGDKFGSSQLDALLEAFEALPAAQTSAQQNNAGQQLPPAGRPMFVMSSTSPEGAQQDTNSPWDQNHSPSALKPEEAKAAKEDLLKSLSYGRPSFR